jgi:hypothetical protein
MPLPPRNNLTTGFTKSRKKSCRKKQINKPVEPQQEIYTLPKEETFVLPVEIKTVTTSRKVFVAMPENHVPKKQSPPVIVKTSPIVEEKPVIIEEKRVEAKPLYTEHETLPKEPRFTETRTDH